MAEVGNSIGPSRGQAGQPGAPASAGQVTSITPEAQQGDLPQAKDQAPGKTPNHKYKRMTEEPGGQGGRHFPCDSSLVETLSQGAREG